jgi:hypothetical protein
MEIPISFVIMSTAQALPDFLVKKDSGKTNGMAVADYSESFFC